MHDSESQVLKVEEVWSDWPEAAEHFLRELHGSEWGMGDYTFYVTTDGELRASFKPDPWQPTGHWSPARKAWLW